MEINAPSEGLLCFGLMADKQMNKVKKGNKKNNSKQRMSRRIERHTRLFTALHGVHHGGLAMRILSVRLTVCPSVYQTRGL